MILIGQYDSPFVRRVGIAMALYDLPFEHKPWSTFGDAEKIRPFNPLMRVPVLVLDNDDALIESHVIVDYVDRLMPAGERLYPESQPERHQAMKIASLATGLSDKAVALFYELRLHKEVSDLWVERCRSQIVGVLTLLETDRAARADAFWFGNRIGHADIAVGCALRHLTEAHPELVEMKTYPALAAHSGKMEALQVFEKISQPFIAPAG